MFDKTLKHELLHFTLKLMLNHFSYLMVMSHILLGIKKTVSSHTSLIITFLNILDHFSKTCLAKTEFERKEESQECSFFYFFTSQLRHLKKMENLMKRMAVYHRYWILNIIKTHIDFLQDSVYWFRFEGFH